MMGMAMMSRCHTMREQTFSGRWWTDVAEEWDEVEVSCSQVSNGGAVIALGLSNASGVYVV
jgi:hypothetical protein